MTLALQTIMLLLIAFILGAIFACMVRRSLRDRAMAGTPHAAVSAAPKPPARKAPKTSAAAKPKAKATTTRKTAAKPKAATKRKPAARARASADDLKQIKGVGKGIEAKLSTMGIKRFDQIAKWKRADIDKADEKLNFKGRIDREKWVAQAKVLAKGSQTEFSKRVKKGDVKSSK